MTLAVVAMAGLLVGLVGGVSLGLAMWPGLEVREKAAAWSRGYQCAHDDMTAGADTDA